MRQQGSRPRTGRCHAGQPAGAAAAPACMEQLRQPSGRPGRGTPFRPGTPGTWLGRQSGQYQKASGAAASGGSRQNMWKPRSHWSHSSISLPRCCRRVWGRQRGRDRDVTERGRTRGRAGGRGRRAAVHAAVGALCMLRLMFVSGPPLAHHSLSIHNRTLPLGLISFLRAGQLDVLPKVCALCMLRPRWCLAAPWSRRPGTASPRTRSSAGAPPRGTPPSAPRYRRRSSARMPFQTAHSDRPQIEGCKPAPVEAAATSSRAQRRERQRKEPRQRKEFPALSRSTTLSSYSSCSSA